MVASTSPGAEGLGAGAGRGERFSLLRCLGDSIVPCWLARERLPDGRTELVVVVRVGRGGESSDQEIADWVRDARCISSLAHPNVARVRDVIIREQEVLVCSEFVDGVRWSELRSRLSLGASLRVLVDVLSGLSVLHNLRDAKRQPLKLLHRELTPDNVVVGLDGLGRIINACRVKSPSGEVVGRGVAYLAPEVLLEDDSADARADIFSVGVMLWEALSGQLLFSQTESSAIVTKVLGGRLAPASVPTDAPWAAPLVPLVSKCLAADPATRFPSAAQVAAELRRVSGKYLVPSAQVASQIAAAFGDAVRMRRALCSEVEPPAPSSAFSVATPLPPTPPAPVQTSRARLPSPAAPAVAASAIAVRAIAARAAPPIPPARPPMPTLTGVAPQAPLDTDASSPGAPVVVPSSNPPSLAPRKALFDDSDVEDDPTRILRMPSPPRVPRDLALPAESTTTDGSLPVTSSSVASFEGGPRETRARPRFVFGRKARVRAAAIALGVVLFAVGWWTASRPSGAPPSAAPSGALRVASPSGSLAPASPRGPRDSLPANSALDRVAAAAPTPALSAAAAPTPAPSAAAAPTPAPSTAAAPTAGSGEAPVASPVPSTGASGPRAVPVAPAPRTARPKYEPQGI